MKCVPQMLFVFACSAFVPAFALGREAEDGLNWEIAQQFSAQDVFAIRFHPVQDDVFAADTARSVATIYEVGKRVPVVTVEHRELIADLAWSPDGALLATASYDGTVRLTSFPDGQQIGSLMHPGKVARLAFSHSGEFLATILNGGDRALRIWHVPTGKLMAGFVCDSPLAGRPTFSHDDMLVAAGGGLPNNGRVVVAKFQADAQAAAFTAAVEPQVNVSASSPRIRRSPKPPSGNWEHVGTLTDFSWGIQWLTFIPGTHQLVVNGTTDSTVQVRDFGRSAGSGFLPVPEGVKKARRTAVLPVLSLAVSPDGTCIASSSTRGVWSWRTKSREAVEAFVVGDRTHAHIDMAFSPDSKYLLTLTGALWDMKDSEHPGRRVKTLPDVNTDGAVGTAVAFSRSGRYIALGGLSEIKVWDNPDYKMEVVTLTSPPSGGRVRR